jgi:hypothetical protein
MMQFSEIIPNRLLVAVVAVAALLVVLAVVIAANKPSAAPALSRAELEQAARAEVARNQQEGRRVKEEVARVKKAALQSQANPFDTDQGRAIMLGLFIKPVLREMLNDPNSLQDLSILSVRRLKGTPTTFRVAVSYRARNAFGALVGSDQVFACIANPHAGNQTLDTWIVLPVKR